MTTNTELSTVEHNEIIEADVVPNFGITLEEARHRVQQLQTFVREQMREGEDFGIIPGTKKPSLWKSGAEKLNMIFGLAPHVEIIDKHVCYGNGEEKPFFAYEVKVQLLNKRDGRIEAEGVGACNSGEKKYRSQNALDVSNTVLKMAKKRALVDATLSATRASGIFTQDVEDMPREAFPSRGNGRQQPQQPQPQQPQPQQPQPQYDPLGDVTGANLDWLIECREWILRDVPGHPQRAEVIAEIKRQQEANREKVAVTTPVNTTPVEAPAREPRNAARRPKTAAVDAESAYAGAQPADDDDDDDPFAEE